VTAAAANASRVGTVLSAMRARLLVFPSILTATMLATPAAQGPTARITPDNAATLVPAWTYDTRMPTETAPPRHKKPAFEATPVYHDGRLYLATPTGQVMALDAETGAEAWRVDLAVDRGLDYGDFANRGVLVAGNRVYATAADDRLVCLEADSGRPCTGFGSAGAVDLSQGLRRPPRWRGEHTVTSPPVAYRDLVIVGSSIADNSRADMASGEVRAFDAKTGALRWAFHPLPADSPTGGANTWSRIVVDDANGLAFLPVGSASPDYFGGNRPGDNAHANALVALKAATGEVAWSFQTVHHDVWDYDIAAPPLLFPGRTGPAVAVGPKSGSLFFFDRLSGKPHFPIVERPVPPSDVPEERTWPTQPVPEKPANLTATRITEADVWGATPAEREACLARFRSLRYDGPFTPPSLKGSLHVPGSIGGLHWGGMAWAPEQRLLIAPVNRLGTIIRLIPRTEFVEARRGAGRAQVTEQAGTPYAMSREMFLSPEGRPCLSPPWGELVAVRVDSGEIAWRTTLGDLRDLVGLSLPDSPGSPALGGPAVSSGGVIFIGATIDPHLRAFAASDGRALWKVRLPTSARATPLIYTTPRGREMVAIAAGGHDTPLSKPGTTLHVFALPAR
jgi:quinoprotein glucose dehydrogenase